MRLLTLLLFIAFFAVMSLAQDAEDESVVQSGYYIPDSTPSASGNELPGKAKRAADHENPFPHMKAGVLGDIHRLGNPSVGGSGGKGGGGAKPITEPFAKKEKAAVKGRKGDGGVPADVIATGPPAAAAAASRAAKAGKGGH